MLRGPSNAGKKSVKAPSSYEQDDVTASWVLLQAETKVQGPLGTQRTKMTSAKANAMAEGRATASGIPTPHADPEATGRSIDTAC